MGRTIPISDQVVINSPYRTEANLMNIRKVAAVRVLWSLYVWIAIILLLFGSFIYIAEDALTTGNIEMAKGLYIVVLVIVVLVGGFSAYKLTFNSKKYAQGRVVLALTCWSMTWIFWRTALGSEALIGLLILSSITTLSAVILLFTSAKKRSER